MIICDVSDADTHIVTAVLDLASAGQHATVIADTLTSFFCFLTGTQTWLISNYDQNPRKHRRDL